MGFHREQGSLFAPKSPAASAAQADWIALDRIETAALLTPAPRTSTD